MDRRSFIAGIAPFAGALISGCKPNTAAPPPAAAAAAAVTLTEAQARRIGMTTVCWRHNMTPPVGDAFATGPKFDILGAPKIFKDTFGIRNVEVWNYQLPEKSADFAAKLRGAAESIGSRILNLQLDQSPQEPCDLSSADSKMRADSIAVAKSWMDIAKALGSPTMRVNVDSGAPNLPLKLGPATESFKTLAEYGQSIGVKILVENHIGASAKVDNCVALLKAVNHPFCRGLIDWGNSAATTAEGRVADLSKMFPFVELVSAKGLHFDAAYNHTDYPIAPLVTATEASGYKGVYSIELYAEPNPPADTTAAVTSMIKAMLPELKS
jgi:sugar phosphate isomerase/epimerase